MANAEKQQYNQKRDVVATALRRLDTFSFVMDLADADKCSIEPGVREIAAAKVIKRFAMRGDQRASEVLKYFKENKNIGNLLRN